MTADPRNRTHPDSDHPAPRPADTSPAGISARSGPAEEPVAAVTGSAADAPDLVLRFYEDLSFARIALVLDCTEEPS